MSRLGRNAVLFAWALGVACAGCSGPNISTVTGEVTLDGQPLKEGIIRFVPVNGDTPTADAPIVNGRFKAPVPPGQKRVEISAPKPGKKRKAYDTPDSPEVEDVGELIPERYNAKSELPLTVQQGAQEKRFELKGK